MTKNSHNLKNNDYLFNYLTLNGKLSLFYIVY